MNELLSLCSSALAIGTPPTPGQFQEKIDQTQYLESSVQRHLLFLLNQYSDWYRRCQCHTSCRQCSKNSHVKELALGCVV